MDISRRLQQECMDFFCENRYAFVTLRQLSLVLGRNAEELKGALGVLLTEDRVEKVAAPSEEETIYCFK